MQYRCALKRCAGIADHFRKTRKRSSWQVLVIEHFGNVVLRAKVLIDLFHDAVSIRAQESWLGGGQIVILGTGRRGIWKKLEPLFGKRILQARIGGANHVGSVAIAAHELLVGGGIVNRVTPMAEITLPFRKGRNRKCGPGQGATNPESFKIGKEERSVILVFPERKFQWAAEISAKIVLDILRFVGGCDAPLGRI